MLLSIWTAALAYVMQLQDVCKYKVQKNVKTIYKV